MHGKVQIVWHKCVDSTNSEVRRYLGTLADMSVTAAVCQTAGRGRGCHSWASEEGKNLTFSILLRFTDKSPLRAAEAKRITHAATLAVRDFLASEGVESRIKWPNDVWVSDRKICGMLIENILKGDFVDCSIVGIGINLNQTEFDPALPNPVSLKLLTGRDYQLKTALEQFCALFAARVTMLDTTEGRDSLEEEFNSNVFTLDEKRQAELEESIRQFEDLRLQRRDPVL